MKKAKMKKIQKLRAARIQKFTFISMAILMGLVQYLDMDCHDYKLSIGRVTVTLRL